MREHNVLSCSKGYIQRVTQSYEEVTLEKVRKYFLNTLKFAKLYMEGETAYTVNHRMKELRKEKRCHRGSAEFLVDHSKKVYSRSRL